MRFHCIRLSFLSSIKRVKRMTRRRKNLKQVGLKQDSTLKNCQSIVSSNQIELMDAKGENSLALFPAKFPESRRAVTQRKRKRERRRRRRSMCEIPEDLVIRILMRLPAKSLMRFKCVSKQWSSLISCPYFSNVFLTVAQQPRLYMSLVAEDRQCLLLSISSTSPGNTCFVVDQDLSIPGIGGFFLNGARGLMCFSVRGKPGIYNPATKQYLTLPKTKPDIKAGEGETKHHMRYYIGYDPVKVQYKLFCTTVTSSEWLVNLKPEHWVLVLEAGGSWKKVVPHDNYHPHAPFSLGRSISGSVVYYMAWLDVYTCAIVSFDIRSEELTTFPVPLEVRNVPLPATMLKAELIEYGEKIAIFNHSYLQAHGEADLWVLEDVGKKEWSRKSFVLQPCQRHLVPDAELIVKGTTEDGRVILAPLELRSQFYILCYDMQRNDLRKVEIKGVPQVWFDKDCYFDLRFMDKECYFDLRSAILT